MTEGTSGLQPTSYLLGVDGEVYLRQTDNWKYCPVCSCRLDDHWQSVSDWYEYAESGEDPSAYHAMNNGEIGEACNDCCNCLRFADGEDYA